MTMQLDKMYTLCVVLKWVFKNSYKHLSGFSNCHLQKDEPVARFCRMVKGEKPATSQVKMGLRVS